MSTKEFNKPPREYTPEEAASQHAKWIMKYLNLQGDKQNNILRKIIVVLLISQGLFCGALVYQGTKSVMVPYVIEKDISGNVVGVGLAKQANYIPQEREKQYFIERFIHDIRTISMDPIVAKKQLTRASGQLTQTSRVKLQEELRKENTTGRLGIETAQIQIKSTVALSLDTYQINWMEEVYSKDGSLKERYNMVGSFTTELSKPRNEAEWRENPLGIFIKSFSWARELR